MIWDTMLRAIEKGMLEPLTVEPSPLDRRVYEEGLRYTRKVLGEARLFHFPARPEEVLPKRYTPEQVRFFTANFMLPFPVTAVEDAASLVILWTDKRDQRGIKGPWRFLAFQTADREHMEACHDFRPGADPISDHVVELSETIGMLVHTVVTGTINEVRLSETKPFYDVSYNTLILITEEGKKFLARAYPIRDVNEQALKAVAKNVGCGLQELMYFNSPDHYILETVPKRVAEGNGNPKKKLLPRSHQRPLYTMLRPKQIRKQMHLPEPGEKGGPKREGHYRRAHYRTYPDDPVRWPKAHGQTVIIPLTWIGPMENTVGKKRYRVLVDVYERMWGKERSVSTA